MMSSLIIVVFMACAPQWVACAESEFAQAAVCAGVDNASGEKNNEVQEDQISLIQIYQLQANTNKVLSPLHRQSERGLKMVSMFFIMAGVALAIFCVSKILREVTPINRCGVAANQGRLKLTVFFVCLVHFCMSYNMGVMSGVLLALEENARFAHMSPFTIGALTSALPVSACFSAACGRIADVIGRRPCLLAVAGVYMSGALLTSLAPNVLVFIFGRLISGVAVGLGSGLANVYISEVVPASSRGELGCWAVVSGTTGTLVAVLGSLSSDCVPWAWRLQVVLVIVPAYCLLHFKKYIPETPSWLLFHGRHDDAENSLAILFPKASRDEILDEIRRITFDSIARPKAQGCLGVSDIAKTYPKSTVIGIFLHVFQQFSGINAILAYAPIMFEWAGFSANQALRANLAVSMLQVLCVTASAAIVDKIGRRPVTLIGCFTLTFGLGMLMATFWAKDLTDVAMLPNVAVVGMALFRGGFSLSLGPLPWVIIPELFPQEARATGITISTTAHFCAAFLVCQASPMLADALDVGFGPNFGHAMLFALYFVACAGGMVVLFFLLPETVGLDLENAHKSC